MGSKPFDQDEARALTLLSNSAAIAIANACLVESGRRQAEEMAALTERENLAADLHDHVAQTLGFLNLKTEQLQERLGTGSNPEAETELDQIRLALNGAYDQVRNTLTALRRPAITTENSVPGQALVEEVAAYLDDFRTNSGVLADLTVAAPSDLLLPPTVQQQAVNLVREALTNVRRHAGARQVKVCIERSPERDDLQLTVQDDGCGFDPTLVQDEEHLGIMIMRARAERCGGDLMVDSSPGSGTKIVAHFPLHFN
jgi:two-component system nitrate/nitrite sensor histidine kinase NarX